MEWKNVQRLALTKARELGKEYLDRLMFEFKEIDKQALNQYWLDLLESGKKYETNKHGLVLPYVLGITNIDPVESGIKADVEYQVDYPDVDLDFLPFARDPIKEYIAEKYGANRVCSVGSWLTYKPRLALKDAARALGSQDQEMTDSEFQKALEDMLEGLPKEFDEIDKPYDALQEIEKVKSEFPEFKKFAELYPNLVNIAYRMVTRIKTQGKHAGGMIISSHPVGEYVPLAYDQKTKQHVSSWTEGFSQQLSKFGFVKFDLLGLRTMWDIYTATCLVNENREVEIDWTIMDPQAGLLGKYKEKDGDWKDISMIDKNILALCDDVKVETVFQFETDFAMSIIRQVGIKSFWDIVAATSLGRPGPMEQIPSYVKNRDDPKNNWVNGLPTEMVEILKPTNGVIIFQEQLTSIWTKMCGLSVPEAENARKAVAKKKSDQLMKLEPRIVAGLEKYVNKAFGEEWWAKMTTFGRYAFNKSHAVAYSIISWRCLFLKTYFPAEWWAAVMSHANPKKRAKYVGLTRLDKIEFGVVDCNNLRDDFNVSGDKILPGLSIIKGIGEKARAQLAVGKTSFKHIDEFMDYHSEIKGDGKSKRLVNKSIMERIIKLGAFDKIHNNRKALWLYYVYKYTSNSPLKKEIKEQIDKSLGWTKEEIEKERKILIADWKKNQKKNSKKSPPKKLLNWKPRKKKYNLDDFNKVVKKDYILDELLRFERKYYGFYWHSPLDLYVHNNNTIGSAKEDGALECVIQSIEPAKSAKGNDYLRLIVTDGLEEARMMVFSDQIAVSDTKLFQEGVGIRAQVNWNDKFRSFSCARNTQILGLIRRDEYEAFYGFEEDDDIDDFADIEESVDNDGNSILDEIEIDEPTED